MSLILPLAAQRGAALAALWVRVSQWWEGTPCPRDLPDSSPSGLPLAGGGGLGHRGLLEGAERTLPPDLQGLEEAHFLIEAQRIPLPQDPEEWLLAETVGSVAGTDGAWASMRDAGACRGVLVAVGVGTGSAGFQGHLHREMVADGQSLGVVGKQRGG